MGVRNIKKQLAGVEDLLLGEGTQVQERNSGSVPITKINLVGIVDTVEALATLDITKYTTAIVKDLDRGGTFVWSATGTANGGTVFAGATGYWNRQYDGAINVKWFGAVGDGVTDDTLSMQAAIDYSVYAKAKLLITAGIYVCNSLTIGGSLVIEGEGVDQTYFVAKSTIGQNNMFTISNVDGITIIGCKFDMRNDIVAPNFSDLTKQNVFHFTSCSNVTIRDNHFIRGLNQFIRFDGTALSENVNVFILDNIFENGGKGAVEVRRYGRNVHIESNNMTDVCNSTISGITYDKSISVSGTIGVWIENNYILQNISGGGSIIVEYIDRQSEAVNILNNRVRGSSENGIKVGASVDVRVEGNSCMYQTLNGIYIEGCYDSVVQSNYCYKSGTNAIRIYEDGDTGRLNRNVIVRDNTFQNSNMSGATLGVVGVSVGSTSAYHLACRQSSYVYVYENTFIDDTSGQAGGIYMSATDYYIERNDLLRLKNGSVTFANNSSVSSDRFKIVDNKGAQTTDVGLATILNGTNFVTVTPNTVSESTDKRMQASLNDLLTGTAAYWCILDGSNQTFTIRTRTSAHASANVTADTKFTWQFSVTNAIGIFGQTAV